MWRPPTQLVIVIVGVVAVNSNIAHLHPYLILSDKAVVANSQKALQQPMDNLTKVVREFGMKINAKETKVMCLSQKGNNQLEIYVAGQQVEQVSQSRYLGSLLSEDGFRTAQKIL